MARLTTKQAAFLVGRTPLTLWLWRRAGEGPPWEKVMGRYFYDSDVIEAWKVATIIRAPQQPSVRPSPAEKRAKARRMLPGWKPSWQKHAHWIEAPGGGLEPRYALVVASDAPGIRLGPEAIVACFDMRTGASETAPLITRLKALPSGANVLGAVVGLYSPISFGPDVGFSAATGEGVMA